MSKRCPEGRPRILPVCAAFLTALLLLPPGQTQALPRDQEQPIHISADKALRDEKQGVTVYTGDVQMNQGSIYIEADELTIFHINEEADKIVAVGKPARMRQRPDLEKGPVHARASRIEYFRAEERVHLQTNARIEQDGAIVAGDSIDYFIAEQLVKADSDQAREGNRVQVVIPPSVQQDAGIAPRKTPAAGAGETGDAPDPQSAATATEPEDGASPGTETPPGGAIAETPAVTPEPDRAPQAEAPASGAQAGGSAAADAAQEGDEAAGGAADSE